MSMAFVDLQAQYARLKPKIEARINGVLAHGRFINGPEVGEVEEALGRFVGGEVCTVGVSSGTDALVIALMAEGIGPGDAIFLPAFTFTATAEVAVLLGATPVFVDVDERTFNIDPGSLEDEIERLRGAGGARPRAVIAVDLFGLPAEYPALERIAGRHGLAVIADAAQSFGSSLHGRRTGRLAPVTAISFFPAKPLGCYGDGGALLTTDPERAADFRSIRSHGAGEAKYDIVRIGLNARLDTIQAAVLLAKLEVFEDELAQRERLARFYDERLEGIVTVPRRISGYQSAWAQYSILHPERDRLAAELSKAGVPTAIYYPRPLHLQPAYERFGRGTGTLPVSERLCEQILSLPMHPYMCDADTARVVSAVAAALGR